MKLIRLTSDDNLVFKADFDADIKLGENSSIALQNLTSQINYTIVNVGGVSSQVGFTLEVEVNTEETADILEGEYTAANFQELIREIQYGLNKTLKMNTNSALGNFGNYGQFILEKLGSRNSITFRLSPTVNPCTTRAFSTTTGANYEIEQTRFLISDAGSALTVAEPNPGDPLLAWGAIYHTTASTATLSKYIYPANPGIQWCKGSAVWFCRLQYLQAEAGDDDTKGFAIGLSYTRITDFQTAIQDAERQYEIRVFREAVEYGFIRPEDNGVMQVSTLVPYSFDPGSGDGVENNDLIMIRKDKNLIRGYVLTASGAGGAGVENLIFSVDLDDSAQVPVADKHKPLFPYAYVCGTRNQTTIGQPTLTLDPFSVRDYFHDIEPEFQNAFGDPRSTPFQTVSLGMRNVVPILDNTIYNNPGGVTSSVTLHNTIWRVLGFVGGQFTDLNTSTTVLVQPFGNSGTFPFGFRIIGNGVAPHLEGNNLVVILDSNGLESYDASKNSTGDPNDLKSSKIGKRMNILCTLPYEANLTDPKISFEPNQLNFIDFDNAYPQTLRNLRLRVVDKFLTPLTTTGRSVMTLLLNTK
jgi:hypothetical protein